MDIVVRPYGPGDLEVCRALWAELTQRHRELYHDPSIGGDTPGCYFDRHLESVGPQRIWVAERGGEGVGMFGLMLEDEQATIEPLVVSALHRGQGIGRLLLDRAVQEARALGVRFLCIKAVARNVEAIRIYHRAGFRTLGEIEMFMELRPTSYSSWEAGPEILGCTFDY